MDASIDVIHHAHRPGFRVEEVGTTIDYDVDDASSHNPISHGLVLFRNVVKTAGFERPISVLGAPSFVISLVGLVTFSFLFLGYLPAVLTSPATVLFSSMVFLSGLVLCLWATVVGAVKFVVLRDQ